MTREGGKPLARERGRGRLDGRRLRLLRRDRPQLRRPRDPVDRVDAARARAEGADRRRRLHRPLELPAAAARLEARARARGREHDRLQAVGADAALDARARALLRAPAARRRQPARRRGRRGRGDRPRRARRLRRLHGLGRRPASGSPRSAPSASRASTSRWAARTRSSSAPTSPARSRSPRGRRLGGVPERGPGVHLGRALLRASTRSTTTSCGAFVDYTESLVARRPARPGDRRRADGVGAPARARRRAGRGGRRGGRRRSSPAATARATRRGHFFAPAVVTGAPRETDLLREETFGPVAPIVPVKSLDEAIELANSTRYGLGCNVYTRDLETIFRCMREIKAGTVWFNDPLTDNDAGPVRRHEAVGARARARRGRARGVPGDEARPPRDADRAQGLVVPLRRRRARRRREAELATVDGHAGGPPTAGPEAERDRLPRLARDRARLDGAGVLARGRDRLGRRRRRRPGAGRAARSRSCRCS